MSDQLLRDRVSDELTGLFREFLPDAAVIGLDEVEAATDAVVAYIEAAQTGVPVTCGYPVPTGVPATTPCELGRWHRGEGHRVTLDHATVTVVDSNAPEGAGPWPPAIVVIRDSDSPTYVEQFGCDATVVIIDNGADDLDDDDQLATWAQNLDIVASGFPDGHPAAELIRETVESEQSRRARGSW